MSQEIENNSESSEQTTVDQKTGQSDPSQFEMLSQFRTTNEDEIMKQNFEDQDDDFPTEEDLKPIKNPSEQKTSKSSQSSNSLEDFSSDESFMTSQEDLKSQTSSNSSQSNTQVEKQDSSQKNLEENIPNKNDLKKEDKKPFFNFSKEEQRLSKKNIPSLEGGIYHNLFFLSISNFFIF